LKEKLWRGSTKENVAAERQGKVKTKPQIKADDAAQQKKTPL